MITYFDTSALVKKYNLEDYSKEVIDAWNKSDIIVTSVLTYAEILAVFGRKLQDNSIGKKDYDKVVLAIEKDWETLTLVNISNDLQTIIKRITKTYYLRGFDAVHLGSALYAKHNLGNEEYSFACFDKQLNNAAIKESFTLSFE